MCIPNEIKPVQGLQGVPVLEKVPTVPTNSTDLLFKLKSFAKQIQTWKSYRAVHRQTQPAHILTILSVITISKILHAEADPDPIHRRLMKLAYLGSFAAHFGAQIWMTFVSGLSLYFALPRHTFGSVQKILFPKYFTINSILSIVTLFTFVKCQTATENNQNTILVACFVVELLVRLYLAPVLVELMIAKNIFETEAGVGTEVGKYDPGSLVSCPEYVKLHSRFRKVHMTIAIGNMATMGCTIAHLYYLSQRLCI